MSKEHKTLTDFYQFLVNTQNHLQVEHQNTENIIQDYYTHRIKQDEIAKEENRLKQLKKLELLVKKRDEQQKRAKTLGNQIKPKQIARKKRPEAKKIKEMQALIDRIRN